VFAVWEGGLSFHGGIIGGLLASYFFFRKVGIPFLEVMDSFAPGVSLGIMLVRIGNFMNGDILGFEWNGPWAMNFPHDDLHFSNASAIILRHPTELYGLVVGLICTLVAMVIWIETYETRRFATGATFMGFILSYSLVRSVIEEPFRDVPLPWKVVDPKIYGFGLFTTTQIVSFVLILVAIWGFTQLRVWEKRRLAAPPAPAPSEQVVAEAVQLHLPSNASRQVRRAAIREKSKHKKR
jgi:phosphatidylglycerol---prolipoprotein diacylglyceryl transferase